ncbi:hypothetical protein JL720_2126 [Aureococcus anophagefferens]|nr:hypothetical protein JL720_2126 [Aureococcus anophagefferens]
MFAFDHASLVDADRRYLEALHGRAVSAANVTALYASTLEATDGGACLAPREKSCLDGFCSAGDWRDYRRSPLFGCRGGLGAGLPSYELFERATTAASASAAPPSAASGSTRRESGARPRTMVWGARTIVQLVNAGDVGRSETNTTAAFTVGLIVALFYLAQAAAPPAVDDAPR